jgi:hypothetical protein
VDAVVTKPGFGILSDCVANAKPIKKRLVVVFGVLVILPRRAPLDYGVMPAESLRDRRIQHMGMVTHHCA